MTHFVLGFLFSTDLSLVLLIRKARPSWQAGRLNGIGGKVERGEGRTAAMVRECREETELETCADDWSRFCTMDGPDFKVECFAGSFACDMAAARGTYAEPLEVWDVSLIHSGRAEMTDGLQWLIPMALDHLRDGQPDRATVQYGEWPVRKAQTAMEWAVALGQPAVKASKTGRYKAAKKTSK